MGDLDLSLLVDRPENLFPFGEHGGFALVWTAPHTREVHTFVLPEGRGKWAADAAAEMIRIAAINGTSTLWTQIDPDLPHVRLYAERAGMEATGETCTALGKPHAVFSMVATCQ